MSQSNRQMTEYCKLCDLGFEDWDALLLHKVESKDHIACIFCGIDFRTLEGQKRHQQQAHAAQQDLKCAGCGEKFIRAGSYINHIEHHLCRVINKEDFEQRRKKKLLGKNIGKDGKPRFGDQSQTMISDGLTIDGSGLSKVRTLQTPLIFDDTPKPVPWGKLEERESAIVKDYLNFPSLDDKQQYLSGGSNTSDLLTGPLSSDKPHDLSKRSPPKLDSKNEAWLDGKKLFPDAPPPVTPSEELLAALTASKEKEEIHPWDPSNPNFQAGKFYNAITEQYKCPWPFCKKTFTNTCGLCQHLRSPAHTNEKLRCPACLRLYNSATALVQHAESQAKKCSIRDTVQYRQAVDQITGGLIDTRGRHEDQTVRYIAPALATPTVTAKVNPTLGGGKSSISQAHDDYWTQKEDDRQAQIKYLNENTEW